MMYETRQSCRLIGSYKKWVFEKALEWETLALAYMAIM